MNERWPHAGEKISPWQRAWVAPPVPALGRRIWLITFTDLVSLMLAFFVMLFAMSGVKVEVWEATASSLSRTAAPSRVPPPPPVAAYNVPTAEPIPGLDLDYLATLFHRIRRDSTVLVEIRLIRMPDALLLALNADEVFAGDGAELSPAATQTLSAVAGILGNFSNRIGVRLHAAAKDSLDADSASAWEFALVRAAALTNGLRAAGYDGTIAAHAVTSGDLAASDGAAGPARDQRIAQIEIVILAETAAGR